MIRNPCMKLLPQAPFFDLEKMMAEQAAIEAKIEAVNRAEVERERLMKMKEEQEKMAMAEMLMAAAKEEQEAEMAEMMALEEAEKMAMVEAAEKMVAEEVAKEVFIGFVLLAFDVKRSLRRVHVRLLAYRWQFKREGRLPPNQM